MRIIVATKGAPMTKPFSLEVIWPPYSDDVERVFGTIRERLGAALADVQSGSDGATISIEVLP